MQSMLQVCDLLFAQGIDAVASTLLLLPADVLGLSLCLRCLQAFFLPHRSTAWSPEAMARWSLASAMKSLSFPCAQATAMWSLSLAGGVLPGVMRHASPPQHVGQAKLHKATASCTPLAHLSALACQLTRLLLMCSAPYIGLGAIVFLVLVRVP